MECATLPPHALPGQSDERLVELTRAGDQHAFEEIVRRYRPALVRYAAGFLLDGRAEDVVQEALIRSHRALLANGNEIQLRSWLYRIVHNGAISELRATRPHEQLDEGINGVAQPPEQIERREQVRGVVAKLKTLPASQRQALVASELEGASHEQIAASLGTTPGAVSQLIFRARTALRTGAASMLPLPLLRWISKLAGQPAAAGAAGSGGAAAGGIGLFAGGGGAKLGATLAAAVIAVGSGAALEHAGEGDAETAAKERRQAAVSAAASSPDLSGRTQPRLPAAAAVAASSSEDGHSLSSGSEGSGSSVVRASESGHSGSSDSDSDGGGAAGTTDGAQRLDGGGHDATAPSAGSGPGPSGPHYSPPPDGESGSFGSGPSGGGDYRPPPSGSSPTSHYSSQGPGPGSEYPAPTSELQQPPPDGGDGFSGPGGDRPSY